ncbi:hypothetical protein LNTAR_03639 [Lentisphaera araneosa HTCC2155]|uniref:Uncharacterized protein n=1 Tax=Lentisphaera araneosa HTCC2155 TaxID=313628 RepID=A6DST6_9BACT|nr:hypothetical protein LNTAR_03639 [Lentisphaera araneosa HTCC2155]
MALIAKALVDMLIDIEQVKLLLAIVRG